MVRPLGESGCLSSTRIILHETFPFLLYRKYGLYATDQFLIFFAFPLFNDQPAQKVEERFHLLLFSINDSIFPIHMIGNFCYKEDKS